MKIIRNYLLQILLQIMRVCVIAVSFGIILSCAEADNTDLTSNSGKTTITGTFAYNPLNVVKGVADTATPIWTGALATQTVTYTIVKQGGTKPASISIDSITGIISVAASTVVADSGTYTITASGTGNYIGSTTANIVISVTGDIQGTLTYNRIDVVKGTVSTATPTWTGALANQTVTYTITRKSGGNLPASITIDSNTGIISVATDIGFQDHGTYIVTASGTGSYKGSTTANIVVTITMVITTAAELQAIANNTATLASVRYNTIGTANIGIRGAVQYIGGNYQLGGNIDLSGVSDFTPIGRSALPFIGSFDGKGYKVTLAITSTERYIGLFGYVGVAERHTDNTTVVRNINSAIEIKNIGVNGTVTSTGNRIGGLVGQFNGGSIIGYSEVVVEGANNVGGLVGFQNGGRIIGYATGAVSARESFGGLVGDQFRGSIIGYATGNLTGNITVGGLAGWQDKEGTITGYTTSTMIGIAGFSFNKNGFIGVQQGTIKGGYFDAASTGRTDSAAISISAAANIYKFAGSAETSGRTVGKFYDKATGTSSTVEDARDTEIFTVQEFIDAFDLANTPNGRFPKLKTSLFGTLPQP